MSLNLENIFSTKVHIQIDKIPVITSIGLTLPISELSPGDIVIIQDACILVTGMYQSDFQAIDCISDEGYVGSLSWIQEWDITGMEPRGHRIAFFDEHWEFYWRYRDRKRDLCDMERA